MESASAFLGVLGHQPWENSWRIHVLPTQFQVSNSNDKKDRKFSMGLKWFTGLKSHMINCLPHDLDMRFHALWSLSLTGSFFFLAFLSKKKRPPLYCMYVVILALILSEAWRKDEQVKVSFVGVKTGDVYCLIGENGSNTGRT
jgi:hypothetical protein